MQYIWSEQGQLPVQAQRIRHDVFMQEQGFCDEFDAFDKKSWHVLLQTNGKTIGCLQRCQRRLKRCTHFAGVL